MLKKRLFRKQQTKLITFTDTIGVAKEFVPKSAVHFIPSWYKQMEASFPKKRTPDTLLTIKKCIPVLDAITAGYIIVTPCDVYVSFTEGEYVYTPALFDNLIGAHPRKQAYGHPSAQDYGFPKWINPWSIRTPKGYSCLFIPPMHNHNQYFEILEGIVDTDCYYARINLPFVLKNKSKDGFIIPAGTPIAQVIPFKRDAWKSQLSNDKQAPGEIGVYLQSHFFDRYKRLFWNRKSYE